VHHCENLDVVPKPIGDDVGNVGQYEFARAGDATDATSGRKLCQLIYSSDEPGNHSSSGIRSYCTEMVVFVEIIVLIHKERAVSEIAEDLVSIPQQFTVAQREKMSLQVQVLQNLFCEFKNAKVSASSSVGSPTERYLENPAELM